MLSHVRIVATRIVSCGYACASERTSRSSDSRRRQEVKLFHGERWLRNPRVQKARQNEQARSAFPGRECWTGPCSRLRRIHTHHPRCWSRSAASPPPLAGAVSTRARCPRVARRLGSAEPSLHPWLHSGARSGASESGVQEPRVIRRRFDGKPIRLRARRTWPVLVGASTSVSLRHLCPRAALLGPCGAKEGSHG